MLTIFTNRRLYYHPSKDVLNEFENAIIKSNNVRCFYLKGHRYFHRMLFFLFMFFINLPLVKFLFCSSNKKRLENQYITISMGLDKTAFSACFFSKKFQNNVYMFDAWPKNHLGIIKLTESINIKNLFLSSRQAVSMLQPKLKNCRVHWIPEGIEKNNYNHKDYSNKNIDVLQIGRKYDDYHKKIVLSLKKADKKYLYQSEPKVVIFPTRKDFIDGLASTKISICFPKHITHPEIAEGISVITNRYFQSIASKCLIVGHAPSELIELFGYNPVIEYDSKNSAKQILDILSNFHSYIPLIEKNYKILDNHSWEIRWSKILSILDLPVSRNFTNISN